MGAINSTVPVLQAEVSPKASRGRFVCAQLSVLNLGIFLACQSQEPEGAANIPDWVGYGFSSVTGSKAWRIPVAMQAIFIIPILVLVIIIPESPRWLASHGRSQESLEVLARLSGSSIDNPDILEQHDEIMLAVNLQQRIGSGSWKELVQEDDLKSRRRFLIACAIQGMSSECVTCAMLTLAAFQQLGGSKYRPVAHAMTDRQSTPSSTTQVTCFWLLDSRHTVLL